MSTSWLARNNYWLFKYLKLFLVERVVKLEVTSCGVGDSVDHLFG